VIVCCLDNEEAVAHYELLSEEKKEENLDEIHATKS
jgi:hypothetical protein